MVGLGARVKGFRYRQAYAILSKRIDSGELPKGQYTFVMGLRTATPRVRGCSLTKDQERVLNNIIVMCSPAQERRAA